MPAEQGLECLMDFCAAFRNFWEIACPSGIGRLQQERKVLLQTGSMSFDRRSLDVPVAWQQQLTDVAPRLKWLEALGLLSRCLAIINSSHQGLCCSYCCFSHKQSENNQTAGRGFDIFINGRRVQGVALLGFAPETSWLKCFVCHGHWRGLYLPQRQPRPSSAV